MVIPLETQKPTVQPTCTVGASLLAKNVNDNASNRLYAVPLGFSRASSLLQVRAGGAGYLVAVSVRLERTFDGHADVVGLGLGQLSHHAAEAADHFQGHFFVEFLRQHFHGQTLGFLGRRQVGVLLAEQEDLRQYLVGERTVHDAAWGASGVTQVYQAAFGQQDQVVVVLRVEIARAGTVNLVYLWLHFFPCPDRKSTRLNSSHMSISYALFCLKKDITASSAGQLNGSIITTYSCTNT